ncbi:MAG: histidine kinase [Lachnospiraceae bacterium]|nr:histidine kinase [Lachnospiraceae bacterium]
MIKKSYKFRIFVCFLTLSVIFILISGLFSVQLFRMKINRDFVQSDIEAFGKISVSLSSAFERAETALENIGNNDVIANSVARDEAGFRRVNAELFEQTREIRDFSTISVYENGNCAYSTSTGSADDSLPVYFSVLSSTQAAQGNTVYSLMSKQAGSAGRETKEPVLGIAKAIGNGESCLVRIDRQGFDKLLSGLVTSGKGFILANSFWEPVYIAGTANTEILAQFRSNILSKKTFSDGYADNAYAQKIGDMGLWGIYVTPPVMIGSAVRSMYTIIIVLTVISIGLSLFMSNRLSNSLSEPLGALAKAMKKLRGGDLDTRMETDREDEFGQLAAGFNKMSGQLKSYMEERIEKEKELNRTQIGMVTAQLNPHFLYNTLDTIKWLAKDNGVQTIADLSSKLAKILRRSISGPAFCTIDDELDLVRNYCDIQEVRFDNKFEVIINTDEGVGECRIPKLIIQPVVENSIIHGLENCDFGRIEINVRRVSRAAGSYAGSESYEGMDGYDGMAGYQGDEGFEHADGNKGADSHEGVDGFDAAKNYEKKRRSYTQITEAGRALGGIIVITVEDNGCGIDEETAGKLRNRDRKGLEGHLGMLNVDTILRLNYGPEYGLTAEHAANGGTRVTLTLPEMK